MPIVKCGHCSTSRRPVYHSSVADVQACSGVLANTRTIPANQPRDEATPAGGPCPP